MLELYENIKQLRIKLNLSQEELAKKVGYKDRTSIAKIESGKVDIPQSKIKAFADALLTTPSFLMGWESNSKDKPVTIAAHSTNDLTEEEQEKVLDYVKYIKSQRKL